MTADGHAAVLKVWSKRHRDIAPNRNQVVCRLHAVLGELVPGGHPKQLAAEFLADLRHLDARLRDTRKKLAAAVRASRTTLTEVFGVGPVIAATIVGGADDVARFP